MRTIGGRPTLFLILTGLLVFGAHAPKAGLHLDDHAFHRTLSAADWPEIKERTLKYVPGRNLYVLYYAGLYRLLGPEPSRLHLFGLGLDIVNALLASSLLLRLGGSAGWSLLFGGLFLVYPNHAETHFWTAAVAMNLLSTTFLLAACRLSAAKNLHPVLRWAACLLLLALAVFDYDQSVLMWLPIAVYAVLLCPDTGLTRGWGLTFAGAGIVFDAAHAFLRAYSPHSEGGRPVIRLGQAGHRAWEALLSSAVPLRKFPIWESLQSWAGGPADTLVTLLILAGAWLWLAGRLGVSECSEAKPDGPPLGRIAAFGLLWMLCAYAPNFFWFLNPRHNYLPSLGFLLALTAGALALARSFPAARKGLAAAAFLFFGLSAAAGVAEGYGWRHAADLHARFTEAAQGLLPDKAANIFLLDAPVSVARAPAFSQTSEHMLLYWNKTGVLAEPGDTTLTPGRTGAFYRNQLSMYGRDTLYWHPYRGMNLLVYDGKADPKYRAEGNFSCAAELKLFPAGETSYSADITKDQKCRTVAELNAPVWMVSSRRLKGAGKKPILSFPNSVALLSSSVRLLDNPPRLELTLLWRPTRPVPDFAFVVTLRDQGGREVFAPVYSGSRGRWPGHETLWPCFNDLLPPSTWAKNSEITETYRFLLKNPIPPGPLEARLTVFEKPQDLFRPWLRLAEAAAPVQR